MLTRKLPLAAFTAATLLLPAATPVGRFPQLFVSRSPEANLLYLPEELCFREQPHGACRSATSAMA